MKNLRSIVMIAMVMFSSVAFGNGPEDLKVKISSRQDDIIAVNFSKATGDIVKIRIFDLNGNVILKEKVDTHELVIKKYDLSQYPDGYYKVEVSNGVYSITKKVEKK